MKEVRSLDKAEANGGYIWIEKKLVQKILPYFSGQAARVYLYLVSKAPQGKNSDSVTKQGSSASEIGRYLRCTGRTITKTISELERLGVIQRVKSPGLSNRYILLATPEENFLGGEKETSQGYEKNFLPPEKITSKVDAANAYGTGGGGLPKNILRGFKKLRVGLRPPQTPSGCGPRKV